MWICGFCADTAPSIRIGLCGTALEFYTNEELNVVGYLLNQKKQGRIRHLGFSAHGRAETIEKFLNRYPGIFEFCQIQLNYVCLLYTSFLSHTLEQEEKPGGAGPKPRDEVQGQPEEGKPVVRGHGRIRKLALRMLQAVHH